MTSYLNVPKRSQYQGGTTKEEYLAKHGYPDRKSDFQYAPQHVARRSPQSDDMPAIKSVFRVKINNPEHGKCLKPVNDCRCRAASGAPHGRQPEPSENEYVIKRDVQQQ